MSAIADSLDTNLFGAAKQCLDCADPPHKVVLATALANRLASGQLDFTDSSPPLPIANPGRPARPLLVDPRHLPQRKLGSSEGRVALIHAVAHIEFNAINLALDAVYRFRGLPLEYYSDWIRIAADEARHFSLLNARLAELGYAYGDFDAHDGLWEMAVKTADSCLARMALVPRVLEARGLDVTPGMITRMRAVGDLKTVAILEVILDEEVAHVAAGSRWFAWCCAQIGADPANTFDELLAIHLRGSLRGPFNTEARLRAGFSELELERIAAMVPA